MFGRIVITADFFFFFRSTTILKSEPRRARKILCHQIPSPIPKICSIFNNILKLFHDSFSPLKTTSLMEININSKYNHHVNCHHKLLTVFFVLFNCRKEILFLNKEMSCIKIYWWKVARCGSSVPSLHRGSVSSRNWNLKRKKE